MTVRESLMRELSERFLALSSVCDFAGQAQRDKAALAAIRIPADSA